MPMKRSKSKEARLRSYDREMLRSAFVSLFWNIIAFKKEAGRFTQKALADKIGVNRSAPTRWFSEKRPNWQVDTIADIADALNVELDIRARDRETGILFAVSGAVSVEMRGGNWPKTGTKPPLDASRSQGPTTDPVDDRRLRLVVG